MLSCGWHRGPAAGSAARPSRSPVADPASRSCPGSETSGALSRPKTGTTARFSDPPRKAEKSSRQAERKARKAELTAVSVRQPKTESAESRGVVGFDVEFVGVYWPPLIAATRALSLSGKSSAIDVSER